MAEPFDSSDEIAVKKRKNRSELQEDLEREELNTVLDTRQGRAVIWRLLEECKPFQTVFRGEETHRMAYLEGRRSIGVELFDKVLQAHPKAYMLMQNEAKQKESA